MKNHFKKILAGVMVGVSTVTMTACGGAQNQVGETNSSEQKVPMGRYMEQNVELPADLVGNITYLRGAKGQTTLYGTNQEGKAIAYTLTADQKWESQDATWLQKLQDEKSYVMEMVVGADEKTYVLYTDAEMTYKISELGEDGTLRALPFERNRNDGMVGKVHVLQNGDLLIGDYMTGVTKYSGQDGSRLMEYGGEASEFIVAGEQLVLVDQQRTGVTFYNMTTGKEEGKVAFDGLEGDYRLIADTEGNIYVINNTGVNRLAKGGSTWENIIESGMSSFGKPSLMVMAASVAEDTFQVLFRDQGNGSELINYTYNPDIPSRPTTEVSVYMLEDNMTIRQAAAEYQRQNPEIMVNLQVGIKSGESTTKSDAIRTLNTELLAGKGPDILLLDGLPMDSYIDKGVLLDMNDIVGPMLDANSLLANIINPYKEDGKIYAVPTTFELPMMWGDKTLLENVNSLQDIAKWAQEHPDQKVMYDLPPSMVMKQFYGASAPSWLDEKGQIKEAEFAAFLEAIKTLSDSEAPEVTTEENLWEARYFGQEYVAYGDTQLNIESLKGFLSMSGPYSAIQQNGNGDFKVMANEGKGVYEARGIVGINANSNHVDIAKGIVEAALSEDVQSVDLGEGFVVNAAAFEKQSKPLNGTMVALGMAPTKDARPIQFVLPDEAAHEQVVEEIQKLAQPAYEDEILLEMIIEETKGYFDGTKTAEEAASAVAQRTKAYLAE